MRLFIAIEIEKALKEKILKIQTRFKGSKANIKYVERKNMHFNLKFIGEADKLKIPDIRIALENACKPLKSFKICIYGVGAFPNKDYAKVLWLGVKDGKILKEIAGCIERELEKIWFAKDGREFKPHLTLGRVKSPRDKGEISKLIEDMKNEDMGEMKVNEIILFSSELRPEGPVYTKIYSVKLSEGEVNNNEG